MTVTVTLQVPTTSPTPVSAATHHTVTVTVTVMIAVTVVAAVPLQFMHTKTQGQVTHAVTIESRQWSNAHCYETSLFTCCIIPAALYDMQIMTHS